MATTTVNPVTQTPALSPGSGRRAGYDVGRDLQRLEEVTGQIVGRMFFGTMLKSMRESILNGTIGHGGRGEEVFAAQLHGILAERMGTAAQGGLKKTVFDTMSRQQKLISERRYGVV